MEQFGHLIHREMEYRAEDGSVFTFEVGKDLKTGEWYIQTPFFKRFGYLPKGSIKGYSNEKGEHFWHVRQATQEAPHLCKVVDQLIAAMEKNLSWQQSQN